MVLLLLSKSYEVYDLQESKYFAHPFLIVQYHDHGFLLIMLEILYIFQLESNLFFFLFQYVQFLHNLKNFLYFCIHNFQYNNAFSDLLEEVQNNFSVVQTNKNDGFGSHQVENQVG